MKAVVVHSPGDIRWEEVPEPDVPEGWARVEIKAIGICSSDVPRALDGAAYHYPIVLGHEMAGVVIEVGEGADPSLVGKRAAVSPLIACHRCEWCARGRYSLCNDYDYFGSRRDGGCAEFIVVPLANLVLLPDAISDEAGALLEPASVVLHGLRGKVEIGDIVAVMGVGSLGLLAVQLARILGARHILAIDPIERRLEIARELSAKPIQVTENGQEIEAIMRETDGRGADLVVVATGASTAQTRSLRLARKGGRVVYLGLPHEDVVIPPSVFGRLVREELKLSGSWNSFSAPYPGIEWRANIAYMASGRLNTNSLITHRMPLEDAESAYRLIKSDAGSVVKVILTRDPRSSTHSA